MPEAPLLAAVSLTMVILFSPEWYLDVKTNVFIDNARYPLDLAARIFGL
jgi:hypothetical protein